MPPRSSSSSSSLIRSKVAPILQFGFTEATTTSNSTTTTATAPNGNFNIHGSVKGIQHSRSVEIWTTTCIVTNFGRTVISSDSQQQQHLNNQRPHQYVLINPCNSGLTGCKLFPYFPKGGPVPKQKVESTIHRDWQPLGYVTQWGGMEVGTGMLYPTSVVDGLVHLYGGSKLQTELYWLRQKHRWNTFWSNDRNMHADKPCPVGHAVVTSAGNGPLASQYDHIVHTTPPFYKYNIHPTFSSEMLLSKCYENALNKATLIPTTAATTKVVATPLLGGGARGFPVDIACQIAAESIVTWLLKSPHEVDASSQGTATSTRNVIQRHVYSLSHNDNDNNKSSMSPIAASSINKTSQNLSSHTLQRGHPRIVFGLLDCTVAKELADRITKLI
jgi:O-acetyl-ADP-ribose deacetylase (regulator of RNase III)